MLMSFSIPLFLFCLIAIAKYQRNIDSVWTVYALYYFFYLSSAAWQNTANHSCVDQLTQWSAPLAIFSMHFMLQSKNNYKNITEISPNNDATHQEEANGDSGKKELPSQPPAGQAKMRGSICHN